MSNTVLLGLLVTALSSAAFTELALASETIQINFTYGSEKKDWIGVTGDSKRPGVTEEFNRRQFRTQSGKVIVVKAIPKGSGESVHEIIDGEAGPDEVHVTSPASSLYVELANTWYARNHPGKILLQDQGSLVNSPVVIAMWEPIARQLGWPSSEIGWSDVMKLAAQDRNFRFGHTHPEKSNSGLSAIVAQFYAGAQIVEGRRIRNLNEGHVNSPEIRDFVKSVQSNIVHYGSSTGFYAEKLVELGPNGMSAAVIYESDVIYRNKEIRRQGLGLPKLVAIYPREGSFASNHPVALVNREWVSNEERAAAEVYIRFLNEVETQRAAIDYGFQPTAEAQFNMSATFTEENGVQSGTQAKMLPVPTGEIIEKVLEAWRGLKNRAKVVVILDRSGSMENGDGHCENAQTGRQTYGRICAAREGAVSVLENLKAEDSFQLITFSSDFLASNKSLNMENVGLQELLGSQSFIRYPAAPMTPINKQKATEALLSTEAQGGTSLYDAVGAGFNLLCSEMQANPADKSIRAIFVLTDGEDSESRAYGMDSLMETVGFTEERPNEVLNPAYTAWRAELQRLGDELFNLERTLEEEDNKTWGWKVSKEEKRLKSVIAEVEVQITNQRRSAPQQWIRAEAKSFKGNPNCKIPIFSISYDAPAGAKQDLERLSKGTGAKSVVGDPNKIRAIFQDLATFL